MFVQVAGDDTSLVNPKANPTHFKFHSDFDLLIFKGNVTSAVTFPIANTEVVTVNSKKSSTSYKLPTNRTSVHTIPLNFTTSLTDFYMVSDSTGKSLTSSFPVQRIGSSFRLLDFHANGSQLVITSRSYVHSDDLPALTLTITYSAYTISSALGLTDPGAILRITDSKVTFGEGKFDSERLTMYKSPDSSGIILSSDPFIQTSLYLHPYRWTDAPSADDYVRAHGISWNDGTGNVESIGSITPIATPSITRIKEL